MKHTLTLLILGCSMAATAQTAKGTVNPCQAGKDCDPPTFVLRQDSAVCYPSIIIERKSPIWKWAAIGEGVLLLGAVVVVNRRRMA